MAYCLVASGGLLLVWLSPSNAPTHPPFCPGHTAGFGEILRSVLLRRTMAQIAEADRTAPLPRCERTTQRVTLSSYDRHLYEQVRDGACPFVLS
jgi:hypothetical protein